MIIAGLTGSIGMGKSTASEMLRRMGVPVFDADATVHEIMAPGGPAVPLVEDAFPGVVEDGVIDRQALGARVFGDTAALRRLEAIIHPMVGELRRQFLERAARERRPLVVLDVPLLFEGGGERSCDATIVVSAPAFLQRDRVLARSGMTEDKLAGVLAHQTPDAEKRRRADYVVPSGLGRGETWRHLERIVAELKDRVPQHWPPRPQPVTGRRQ
jgi:dephospho-CoA kinase